MKTLNCLILVLVFSSGCAHVARTRSTDPVMRVALYPEGISVGSYTRIQKALFDSGKYVVVDRGDGFDAIKGEQERLHEEEDGQRFGNAEKYARWGKMYGVGGVIVAKEQCLTNRSFLGNLYPDCVQIISLVNATTGEVISMGESQESSDSLNHAPSWDNAVEALNKAYPKHMINEKDPNQTVEYGESLKNYRSLAAEKSAKDE